MTEEVVGYKRDLLKERAIIFAGFAIAIILTATRFYIRNVDAGLLDEDDPLNIDSIKDLYSVERRQSYEQSDEMYGMPGGFEFDPYG